jgi:hypothetical protein
MSKEIDVKVKVGPTGVRGKWKWEAKAPLVINSCQHYFQTKTEGHWKQKKEWTTIYHGAADGSCTITEHCDRDRK